MLPLALHMNLIETNNETNTLLSNFTVTYNCEDALRTKKSAITNLYFLIQLFVNVMGA